MAAMTTALVPMTVNGNSRTFRTAAHTVAEPRLIIQKVKYATVPGSTAEDSIRVVFGTSEADGTLLGTRVSFEAVVRRPANADATDLANALALFREIIAADEFSAVVNTQDWLS